MSFQKLSPDERAEWRSLPTTKAAIAFLRERAKESAASALMNLRAGSDGVAMLRAGAEEALRVSADMLEKD